MVTSAFFFKTCFLFFRISSSSFSYHQALPKSGVPRSGGGSHLANADAYFESHQKDLQVRAFRFLGQRENERDYRLNALDTRIVE